MVGGGLCISFHVAWVLIQNAIFFSYIVSTSLNCIRSVLLLCQCQGPDMFLHSFPNDVQPTPTYLKGVRLSQVMMAWQILQSGPWHLWEWMCVYFKKNKIILYILFLKNKVYLSYDFNSDTIFSIKISVFAWVST